MAGTARRAVEPASWPSPSWLPCVGALGALWFAHARSSAPRTSAPMPGFSRDMQTHHAQAVEMALLVRDRSTDEELRTVAYDILTSQQHQAGQMYGWLVQWGLPQTGSGEPMAWVGDEHDDAHTRPDGSMPGMATREQLDELRAADGAGGRATLPDADDRAPRRRGGDGRGSPVAGSHDRGAATGRRDLRRADLGDRAPAAHARRPLLSPSRCGTTTQGAGLDLVPAGHGCPRAEEPPPEGAVDLDVVPDGAPARRATHPSPTSTRRRWCPRSPLSRGAPRAARRL